MFSFAFSFSVHFLETKDVDYVSSTNFLYSSSPNNDTSLKKKKLFL